MAILRRFGVTGGNAFATHRSDSRCRSYTESAPEEIVVRQVDLLAGTERILRPLIRCGKSYMGRLGLSARMPGLSVISCSCASEDKSWRLYLVYRRYCQTISVSEYVLIVAISLYPSPVNNGKNRLQSTLHR